MVINLYITPLTEPDNRRCCSIVFTDESFGKRNRNRYVLGLRLIDSFVEILGFHRVLYTGTRSPVSCVVTDRRGRRRALLDAIQIDREKDWKSLRE